MFYKLFLLFAIIPVVELAILIKVGTVIGAGYTVLLVLSTAAIGAYLVKLEGIGIMARFQRNINEGAFPAEEIFDGAMVLVAGAVLITPGLITDLLGFILVFAPTREILKKHIRRYIERKNNIITIR